MVVEDKTLSAKGLEDVANQITVKTVVRKSCHETGRLSQGPPEESHNRQGSQDKFERLSRTNLTKNRVGRILEPGEVSDVGKVVSFDARLTIRADRRLD